MSCHHRRVKYLLDGHSYSCSRDIPLCKLADLRLADLYQQQHSRSEPLSLDLHRTLALIVHEGHQRALRLVQSRTLAIGSSDDLRKVSISLHAAIFGGTRLDFAGRYRKQGDPPVYYGSGRNMLSGVAPDSIGVHLAMLYDGTIGNREINWNHRKPLIRCCARFLEEFFAIHPFHDGNGRVARLLLRLITDLSGNYAFGAFPEDAKARRKYGQALAYAHRHCHTHANPNATPDTVRDPYVFIAEWLDACLIERVDDDEDLVERQPSWLDLDREDDSEPDEYVAEADEFDDPYDP
jgi:fido (protein-threonine AMPylation protein)